MQAANRADRLFHASRPFPPPAWPGSGSQVRRRRADQARRCGGLQGHGVAADAAGRISAP